MDKACKTSSGNQASPTPSYAKGDRVVYPSHGIGRVDDVAVEEVSGTRIELIRVCFDESRMTVRVPMAKAVSSGLRKLAAPETLSRAMDIVGGRPRPSGAMWSRRAHEFEAKINTGDPMLLAEVVRDLRRNGDPETSASHSEKTIFDRAFDRLASEMAAVEGTDKMDAESRLATQVRGIPVVASL